MRFKIDWASLVAGWKFTVLALFYFVFEGNLQVQASGGFICGGGGRFNGGIFALPVLGAYIHGWAYFRNFTVYTARVE